MCVSSCTPLPPSRPSQSATIDPSPSTHGDTVLSNVRDTAGVGASVPFGTYRLQAVLQIAQGRTTEFVAAKARLYTWGTVLVMVSRSRR